MIPKNQRGMEINDINIGKLYEKGKGQSRALLVLSTNDNGERVLLLKDADALTFFERISGAHKLDKITKYLAESNNVELATKLSPFLNRRITTHNDKDLVWPYRCIKVVNEKVVLEHREVNFEDVKKSFTEASSLRLSLDALVLEREKHRSIAEKLNKEKEFNDFANGLEVELLKTAVRDDPNGVDFILEWIASEISAGSSLDDIKHLDDIKDRLPLSSEDKKVVAFWHDYQRQNPGTLSRKNEQQFDYVLGLVSSFGDIPPEKDLRDWIAELKFNDVAQFKSLGTKIEQIEPLFQAITTAYEGIRQEKSDFKYIPEDITRIALAIIFEVPKHTEEGKIKIHLGHKAQTLFYDSKTNEVYILHKGHGRESWGDFKIVKSVTQVNIGTLKAAQYVQLLTKKSKLGMFVPLERFKISQEKLKREMAFLERHGVEGDFYLRAHKVISYSTEYGGEKIQKVTVMAPEYTGNANKFSGKYKPKESALIIRNTVFAAAGFHKKHLLHQDIKPENLLVLKNKDNLVEKCVLTDYGLSFELSGNGKKKVDRLYGTPHYAAPELLLKKHPGYIAPNKECDFHTFEKFDSFAAGATLYEVVFGRPFWGLDYNADEGVVDTSDVALLEHAKKADAILNDKIEKLKREAKEKLPNQELANQKLAERKFLKVVQRLLNPNPADRMSATEAKKRIIQIEERYGEDVLYSFTPHS